MKKIFLAIFLIILPLSAIFYYKYLFDRVQIGIICGFNKLTGLRCPGCGGQRAFVSLLKGDFSEAFNYNPLIFIFIPLLGYLYLLLLLKFFWSKSKILEKIELPDSFAWYFLIFVLISFFVVNI